MFKSLITCLFCIIPFLNFSQVNDVEKKYKSESKKFINDLINEIKIDAKTILINKAITYDLKDCFETEFIKSDSLTVDEKSEIKIEIENSKKFEWTKDYVDNLKIIENSEYQKIFEDKKNGWEDFRKKYGESILNLSKPIFLRNYSICIISYSVSSGYLSGFGYTSCYKKVNGNWEAFGTMCGWIS